MHPIMLAAEGAAESTPLIVSWLATGFGSLSMLIASLTIAKLGSLTKALGIEKDARFALALELAALKVEVSTAKAKAEGALSEKIFEIRMGSQDRVLATQTDMLRKHDDKLTALVEDVAVHERDLVARPTRSEMNMRAAKAPIPRDDGPAVRLPDDAPTHTLGPMRPRLRSQRDR